MCSASVVGRQDDDDWRTVDVVEQEHQTLACSSSLGTAVLFRAGIHTKEAYSSSSLADLLIDELFFVCGWLCWWDWHRPMFSIINRIV